MDSTFISIILTVLTVAVLWGAYELYRLRHVTEQVAIEIYVRGRDTRKLIQNSPHLFDQETQ